MKTYGILCASGTWLITGDGMMFWTVSYDCACAFLAQINMLGAKVKEFPPAGEIDAATLSPL